jgi:hypothetical protein
MQNTYIWIEPLRRKSKLTEKISFVLKESLKNNIKQNPRRKVFYFK